MVEPRIAEVVARVRALREDLGFTAEEMAEATGCGVGQYAAIEGGEQDITFTFLYKCADKLGVDMVDLLTGESAHLTRYSVVHAGGGLVIRRREGFEYRHLAPTFRNKLAEPFLVTAPYRAEEQEAPIQLSRHAGQELDYVISGRLRFAYEDHVEELAAGDTVYYDSGRGHGMVAAGGEPCTFLAIVMHDRDGKKGQEA